MRDGDGGRETWDVDGGRCDDAAAGLGRCDTWIDLAVQDCCFSLAARSIALGILQLYYTSEHALIALTRLY